ncbi:MAG: 30S ribosomal protein S9 [Parcubacteria group bacterium GW2011_GWA1_40_21]|nr:MAG: 30S ribosomal protein S9 [Parcubacteria group bacterium GW2011_GWC1_40_13]KKR53733.1 MAG: 30S ribosomal protein S9 [Parcubacteria group bacterium GW2011_GWA1_40_21]
MVATKNEENKIAKDSKMENKTYIEAVGRRKTATARVRITESAKNAFIVNDKSLEDYFKVKELSEIASEALTKSKTPTHFSVSAKIKGGGVSSQAEALRLGIARALIIYDKELRKKIKGLGFLKRDPRAKERRKFGLKKARKAPQWSKR